jgi:hypothetical protein
MVLLHYARSVHKNIEIFFRHFQHHAGIVDVYTSSMTLETLMSTMIVDSVNPPALLKDSTGPNNKLTFFSYPCLISSFHWV